MKALDNNLTRAIGISNFNSMQIQELMVAAKHAPVVSNDRGVFNTMDSVALLAGATER
jgi:hypothetical protein